MGTSKNAPRKEGKKPEKARKRFKISVFVIVWDKFGNILAGRDMNPASSKAFLRLKLTGGGHKQDETLLQTILRECQEETGLSNLKIHHNFLFVGKMTTQASGTKNLVEEYKVVLAATYMGEESIQINDPNFQEVKFYSPATLLHEDSGSLNLWHYDAVAAAYLVPEGRREESPDMPGLEDLLCEKFTFKMFLGWMVAHDISPRTYEFDEIANGS
jgi:8-oxo-dGTP pyrophosphatase MutT (NUDIX family)